MGLASVDSANCGWKIALSACGGDPRLQTASCVYPSARFYIRNLSVLGFGICGGPGTNPPKRDNGSCFRGVRSHRWIFDCGAVGTCDPCPVQGSTVLSVRSPPASSWFYFVPNCKPLRDSLWFGQCSAPAQPRVGRGRHRGAGSQAELLLGELRTVLGNCEVVVLLVRALTERPAGLPLCAVTLWLFLPLGDRCEKAENHRPLSGRARLAFSLSPIKARVQDESPSASLPRLRPVLEHSKEENAQGKMYASFYSQQLNGQSSLFTLNHQV